MREGGIILRIVFAIYLVIAATTVVVMVWVAPVAASWLNLTIALLAVLAAETAAWLYAHYALKYSETVKQQAPGYIGLGVVVAGYWAAVSIYALLAIFTGMWLVFHIPLQLITFAVFIVLAGIFAIYLRINGQSEQHEQFQSNQWSSIQNALRDLLRKLDGKQAQGIEETRKVLVALIEQVQYSDPIAPYEIMQQDQSLLNEIVLLQYEVAEALEDEPETRSLLSVADKLREMAAQVASRNERLIGMK